MAEQERLWDRIVQMVKESRSTSEQIIHRWLVQGYAAGTQEWNRSNVYLCGRCGRHVQMFWIGSDQSENGRFVCPACASLDVRVGASDLVHRAELDGLRLEVASLREQLQVERGGVES